ncbi:MAG: 6-carboxytetrahydropterin synthase [Rickettsiales bacterium]|nr:6-carboxytetrahydropterin synthase [Rickettsiales bacterium]
MITCSKRITFEAAHRIVGHEGGCKFLHGHRYICEFTFTAESLDKLGLVIDFSTIKKIMGNWVKTNLDHTVILWKQDKELINAIEKCTKQKIYQLPNNASAENLATHLLHDICPKLFENHRARCIKITIEETEANKCCITL